MQISESISSPSTKPLITIEFPNLDKTPAPLDFSSANDDCFGDTFGDFSALDCAEPVQKLRVKKANTEPARDHGRRTKASEDVAPRLPKSRDKKMPLRSKSESANALLRKLPAHTGTASARSMRRTRTDVTTKAPEDTRKSRADATKASEDTRRPRVHRQNSKTSISAIIGDLSQPRVNRQTSKKSLSAALGDSSRPRFHRQNSKASIGCSMISNSLGDSSRPRFRRDNSKRSVQMSSNLKSARSVSPGPGERRRRNKSKQNEQLNKSLTQFLDANEAFNESFRSLDMASKSNHSKISKTESFHSNNSGHSKGSQNADKAEEPKLPADHDWSDSFFSQDSHPSLTGSTSAATDTWACTCGTIMKDKMRFCGMCGCGKHWICSTCGCEENNCVYVFCGMCGAKKSSSK